MAEGDLNAEIGRVSEISGRPRMLADRSNGIGGRSLNGGRPRTEVKFAQNVLPERRIVENL